MGSITVAEMATQIKALKQRNLEVLRSGLKDYPESALRLE